MTLKHTVLSMWGKLRPNHNGHSPEGPCPEHSTTLYFTKEQAQRLWNASIRELSRGVDYHDNKIIASFLLKDYGANCGFDQGSITKATDIGSRILDCNRFRKYILEGNTAYASQYGRAASLLGASESEITEILAAGAMKEGETVAEEISKGHIELESRLSNLVKLGFSKDAADAALAEGQSHPIRQPTINELVCSYNQNQSYRFRVLPIESAWLRQL
jgi:hypothetical protein